MKNIPVQQGFALVAALIFMVLMSFIALGLSGMTSSEEKMARNFRDQDLAFAAAEAALRDAELRVSGAWQWPYAPAALSAFDQLCSGGLCDSMLGVSPLVTSPNTIDSLDFFAVSGAGCSGGAATAGGPARIGNITGSPLIQGVSTQPCYLIEAVPTILGSQTAVPQNRVFRITAQARGRFANTRVVLQEIYVVSNYVK